MVEEASDIMAARERMIARRFGGANATRTGGVRRKKKNVHKTATSGKCNIWPCKGITVTLLVILLLPGGISYPKAYSHVFIG